MDVHGGSEAEGGANGGLVDSLMWGWTKKGKREHT